MKAERFKQIDELFEAALEIEPAERAAFLGQACASDEELRRKVEALLTADQKAVNFIEAPALEIAARGLAEDQARSNNQTCLAVGRRIDHYETVSILGAGGMGEVYLAEDIRLGRKTALKLLPAQFTQDAERVQRFKREALAASALNHPNIITIYDIGEWEGEHFIATEYIEGQTLREWMSDRTLKVEDALNVALQIASALQAAHAAGIVHRDIKPENVMVRPDGLVKVLDFGLAKPATREAAPSRSEAPIAVTMQTDDGMLMGTIAYLSPEQVLRQEVDHRTDIFSLGVVLYELVTGSRPFISDSVAVICEAILRNTPAPIARADVPDALKRVISRALEKDCAARYQTADEMRSDLQYLIREANGARRGLSSERRSKAVLGLGALVMLTMMLVMGLRRETGSEMPPFLTGPVRRITDTPGQEIFPSLSPDGQTIVYASRAAGNWDIYLKKMGETQAVNLTANSPDYDMESAFSPDGTRIAFYSSREGRGIFLMDRNGQNVTKVSVDGHNPAWSPDGREIALAEDRVFDYEGRNNSHSRLFAVNVQTGARRLITNSDAVQPNWSPNGHRIAYWGVHKGGQRDIWTVPAAGGEPVAVTDDKAVDWNPIWSRDGRHLYFLSNRGGSMNLWRVPFDELSGRVMGQLEPATLPSANSQHLNFSADGRTLVYVEMNRRENTWQVAFDPVTASIAGQAVQVTHGIRRHSHPDLSPDEKSLVFVSAAEVQEDVFVISRDGAQPRQLTNDSAQDHTPRWSPDGQQIAFLSDRSGKYEIWKVNQDGSGLEPLTDVPGAVVINPVWSPDGQRLLYQVRDVNSFIIEPGKPRTAQPPHPLSGQQMPGFLPWSWSPDGKLLAGWQTRPERPNGGVVIYSFAAPRYEWLTDFGRNPIWLNDNRRLLFADLGKIYLLDILTRQWWEIYNVGPGSFGIFALSRDNRRLYYSLVSTEADIWLLSLS